MSVVKRYCTTRKIGSKFYSEEICARSFDEAKLFAKRAGVELNGEVISNHLSIDGGDLIKFINKEGLASCDWDGVINWSDRAAEQLEAFVLNIK